MTNQVLRSKSEVSGSGSAKLPIQGGESEVAHRLREAIGDEPVLAFGRRCGIGESTIRKYLIDSLPNSANLVAMADAANVNIEWLATGRGPKVRGADLITVRERQSPPLPPQEAPSIKAQLAELEALLQDIPRPYADRLIDEFFSRALESRRIDELGRALAKLLDIDVTSKAR